MCIRDRSYIYSFGSYRVDKQTNRRRWKHPTLFSTLRRWVESSSILDYKRQARRSWSRFLSSQPAGSLVINPVVGSFAMAPRINTGTADTMHYNVFTMFTIPKESHVVILWQTELWYSLCLLHAGGLSDIYRYNIARYTAMQNAVLRLPRIRKTNFLQTSGARRKLDCEAVRLISTMDFYIIATCIEFMYQRRRPGVRSIAMISLSVSLSVREHISGTAGLIFTSFFRADPLWPWLGPPLVAWRYVMYFRFYGWRHVWP